MKQNNYCPKITLAVFELVGFQEILKNNVVYYLLNPSTRDEIFIDTCIVDASILSGELERIKFPEEIFDSLYAKEDTNQ